MFDRRTVWPYRYSNCGNMQWVKVDGNSGDNKNGVGWLAGSIARCQDTCSGLTGDLVKNKTAL